MPNGSLQVNGSGKFGDINRAAIQSIKELGATHIWLTGIIRHATQTDYSIFDLPASHPATVKGLAGSPYAITDFFDLDPDLAQNPKDRWIEFSDCRDRIKELGLRVIIDFIPNHTARQYGNPDRRDLGNDLGQMDDTTLAFHPNNAYYYQPGQSLLLPVSQNDDQGKAFEEYPAKATGNDCFSPSPSIFDWYETVKLNYGIDYQTGQKHFVPIPKTWYYMLEVLLFWAEKGIDGFRCDMVEMVPVEFWAWAVSQVKEKWPHLKFIGEVYNPSLYDGFLNEAGFDFLYDKVDLYDQLIALLKGEGDANKITSTWQKQEGFQDKMLRFLENHDEQRLACEFIAGTGIRPLSAFALTVCFDKAAVMLYFGQELGEKAQGASGFSGDDGKTTIFDYWTVPSIVKWNNNQNWNEEALLPEELEVRKVYSKLLNLCRHSEAIRDGLFYDLQYANWQNGHYNSHLNYSFLRYSEEEKILVVCSFSETTQWVRLIIPKEAWVTLGLNPNGFYSMIELMTGETIDCHAQACFESDGGTAGLLVKVTAFGFKILKINKN
ncbi:MAG TPA: alpha-amylase family glycosyl hydrolase [Catalimonadaceae bacterium]|nr:alpha-amylase family glycosyl hydrolase [Catalimonadaceae bacterium]